MWGPGRPTKTLPARPHREDVLNIESVAESCQEEKSGQSSSCGKITLDIVLTKAYKLPMTTKSIKLPKVPLEVLARASAEATMRGISLPAYLTELITKALHKEKAK